MLNFASVKWLKKNGLKLLMLAVVVGVSTIVLSGCVVNPNTTAPCFNRFYTRLL